MAVQYFTVNILIEMIVFFMLVLTQTFWSIVVIIEARKDILCRKNILLNT